MKLVEGVAGLPEPSPGGRLAASDEMCKVLRFDYPKCWKPVPKGRQAYGRTGFRVGLHFKAELKFLDDPENGYYCRCCVFRQVLDTPQVYNGAQAAGGVRRLDKEKDGSMYGGAREDGSPKDSPDNPKAEGGTYSSDGCTLTFEDNPGVAINRLGVYQLSWDFIGLVYDRCRNWLLVDARRFIVNRNIKVTQNSSGQVIVDNASDPRAAIEVGPEGTTENPGGRDGKPDEKC